MVSPSHAQGPSWGTQGTWPAVTHSLVLAVHWHVGYHAGGDLDLRGGFSQVTFQRLGEEGFHKV